MMRTTRGEDEPVDEGGTTQRAGDSAPSPSVSTTSVGPAAPGDVSDNASGPPQARVSQPESQSAVAEVQETPGLKTVDQAVEAARREHAAGQGGAAPASGAAADPAAGAGQRTAKAPTEAGDAARSVTQQAPVAARDAAAEVRQTVTGVAHATEDKAASAGRETGQQVANMGEAVQSAVRQAPD